MGCAKRGANLLGRLPLVPFVVLIAVWELAGQTGMSGMVSDLNTLDRRRWLVQ